MLWGVNNNSGNVATFSKALGRPLDCIREYGWLGVNTDFAGLSVSDQMLLYSIKFRDGSGTVIPSVQIGQGKNDAQFTTIIDQFIAQAHPSKNGQHILIFHHESDSAASAVSGGGKAWSDPGVATNISNAFIHLADLARKRPGFNLRIGICFTGYQLSQREPAFAAATAVADVILIDPYSPEATLPFSSFDAVAGPDVDYLTAKYPNKPIFLGEWGCHADPTKGNARANWITSVGSTLTLPRYHNLAGAAWWSQNEFAISGEPASLKAWASVGNAWQSPPTVTVLKSDYAALQAQAALVPSLQAQVSTLTTQVATMKAKASTVATTLINTATSLTAA